MTTIRIQVSLTEEQNNRLKELTDEANSGFTYGKVSVGTIVGHLIEKAKINAEELQKRSLSSTAILNAIKNTENEIEKSELAKLLVTVFDESAKNPSAAKPRGRRPKLKEVRDETGT